MRVIQSIPVHSHKAFDALSSESGCTHFRHIKKYTSYHRDGSRIQCSYKTIGGTIHQTMYVLPNKIMFRGSGPCNTSFHGVWTQESIDDNIYIQIDQTIVCPFLVKALVKSRVLDTLHDLQSFK
jgi:hypothetical protein